MMSKTVEMAAAVIGVMARMVYIALSPLWIIPKIIFEKTKN